MRIIIPSDGSASCREAIRFIGERAKFMREKPVVELANVQYAIPESIIDRFGLEAVCAVYEAEGRAQLAECTKTAERAGLSVETRVLYGECGPSLAREAQVFRAEGGAVLLQKRQNAPEQGNTPNPRNGNGHNDHHCPYKIELDEKGQYHRPKAGYQNNPKG